MIAIVFAPACALSITNVVAQDNTDVLPLVLHLAPETFRIWSFVVLMAMGIVTQIVGLWTKRLFLTITGAGIVCSAGLLDYDPVLVVGQIIISVALLPQMHKASQKKRAGELPGKETKLFSNKNMMGSESGKI